MVLQKLLSLTHAQKKKLTTF